MGVILVPLIIPWPYFWAHYMKAPADTWLRATATRQWGCDPQGGDQ